MLENINSNLLKIFTIAVTTVAVVNISACGNRGSLYLEHDEDQAQPGHELKQDTAETNKKKKNK